MKRSLVTVAAVTTVALMFKLSVATALAQIIAEHSGSADPTTEGFIADGTPGGSADAGPPDNWRMASGVTDSGFYDFMGDLGGLGAGLTDPSGWTFTYSYKLNASNGPSRAMVRIKDANNRFEFQFFDGTSAQPAGLYYYNNTTQLIQVGTVNPTDGFHTYQMILNPMGGLTDEISFYVDGTLETTIQRSEMQGAGGAPQFFFGKATSSGIVDQQIALARFEIGQHPILAISGDLNSDGFVGQDDLNIVLGFWGQNVTMGDLLMGDPSGDGFVGQDDLNPVLADWGQGTPPTVGALSSVPEPRSLLLLGIGLAVVVPIFRRQRDRPLRRTVDRNSFHRF